MGSRKIEQERSILQTFHSKLCPVPLCSRRKECLGEKYKHSCLAREIVTKRIAAHKDVPNYKTNGVKVNTAKRFFRDLLARHILLDIAINETMEQFGVSKDFICRECISKKRLENQKLYQQMVILFIEQYGKYKFEITSIREVADEFGLSHEKARNIYNRYKHLFTDRETIAKIKGITSGKNRPKTHSNRILQRTDTTRALRVAAVA